ncbi:hypothetical protein GUITHDRAFT_151048 [Guillardia theta CCMP2712]|uniref:Uncharacterized protein n=1 Tax=Guillardia theta (strain CCMP2712) TaxID=905079 RepID=L1JSU4_GUITC|nr:hypothetical protein GUITHDRAFT_151048 [Guillardia theta CCMP2712]EKX51354.1 hypothetical protein GUITHDRAFT_151048 [Guillardia theta CCMP2712]|eukprot:XP_005838334.1 hypothetical protein GUITHDRAFT_151048 [Guillardia theta CCMP2712]
MSYWWFVLVPSERRDLAKNKNKGGLNNYLEDLERSPKNARRLEKWFYTEWLERRRKVRGLKISEEVNLSIAEELRRARPTPNFISLDNPVIIALIFSVLGVFLFSGR